MNDKGKESEENGAKKTALLKNIFKKKGGGLFGNQEALNGRAAYINGAIPPEMRKIAPNYGKWRRVLFKVNIATALAMTALEVFAFTLNFKYTEFFTPAALDWTISNLAIPFVLNFSIILLETLTVKVFPEKDLIKDLSLFFTMTFIYTVCASVHYRFENAIMFFGLPVMASAAFCSPVVSVISAFFAVCGLTVACVCRNIGGTVGGVDVIYNIIIAFAMIAFSETISQIIIALQTEQRNKLVKVFEEFHRSQEEVVAANRAKSDFLANMSHEIRTPINAILGMNEMILREEHNSTIRGYANSIYTSGNLLLSIINDVLDISKIESGKIEITTASYDVASLINDCYNITAARAREKELEFKVECDRTMPRMLYGDEVRIRQIIVNLLTNAIKYTETGYVMLKIGGKRQSGYFVLNIYVRDTGIGISEENQANMFQHFQRFDLEHNRNIEGTGLGLTITKHLLDLMGGEISVKSELNKGSEFEVTVFQEITDDTPLGKIKFNYANVDNYAYVPGFEAPGARILAVDDLPMNLNVITNMLKHTHIQIDTAMSGLEAIEMSEKTAYDLILMDHMMPDMDGIETYLKLRKDEKTLCREVPVIMLTANALSGVREQYMSYGFVDYISKPVSGEKLEYMIMKYLPDELVHVTNSEASENISENLEEDKQTRVISKLKKLLPQLNIDVAMPYCCDSIDLFLSILKDYVEGNRYDELKTSYEEKRFDDYRRHAHSLKSSSLTIGLDGLSERARASEFALKCDSLKFVEINHKELLDMYADALKKIRTFLKEEEDEED